MGLTPGRQSPLSESSSKLSAFAKTQILIDGGHAEQKLNIMFSYLLTYIGQLVDRILKK